MRITKMNLVLNEDCSTRLETESCKEYDELDRLDKPWKVAKVLVNCFSLDKRAEEYTYLIATTSQCMPIGFFEISHGTCNAALVGVREIMIRALMVGAVNIMLVHNHPSGFCNPSKEDEKITKELAKAGKLVGIHFLDHIIIGNDCYYSFREQDRMREEKTDRELTF